MSQTPSRTSDSPAQLDDILASLDPRDRALGSRFMNPKRNDVANERVAQVAAERERQQRIESRLQEFFAVRGRSYEHCDFSNFEVERRPQETAEDQQRRTEVLERCRWVCEGENGRVLDEHIRRGGNVYFHGPPGTGKDHLLVAMLRHVLTHTDYRVKWTTGVDLFQSFRDAIDAEISEASAVSVWCKPGVLAISDLTVEGADLTPHQRGKLYQVLDYRSSHRRGTWVTVNVIEKGKLVESIGESLVDRLCQRSLRVHFNWPSYRNPAADWLTRDYWDKRRREQAASDEQSGVLPFASAGRAS